MRGFPKFPTAFPFIVGRFKGFGISTVYNFRTLLMETTTLDAQFVEMFLTSKNGSQHIGIMQGRCSQEMFISEAIIA